MSYPQWQPPDPNMGRQAGSSFLSGFAGCLGVGLAIIFAFIVVLFLIALAAHH
jgi:hypothetical protein